MTKGDCLHCHTTDNNALGTNGKFSNNGLDNIQNPILFLDKGFGAITNNLSDYGKFKTPSLRNLSFTAPYMHDGRFKTLEEVLDFYSEGVQNSINLDDKMGLVHDRVKLSKEEKKQIETYNIREERLKASKQKKKPIDDIIDSAKKHFEEIFNRR